MPRITIEELKARGWGYDRHPLEEVHATMTVHPNPTLANLQNSLIRAKNSAGLKGPFGDLILLFHTQSASVGHNASNKYIFSYLTEDMITALRDRLATKITKKISKLSTQTFSSSRLSAARPRLTSDTIKNFRHRRPKVALMRCKL